jgi:hypothetical protein
MKNLSIVVITLALFISSNAQRSEKLPRYFDNPILVDSASSIMIPILYNNEMLSANKLALWEHYYANIIFYDVRSDSARRLFRGDTFIKGFNISYSPHIARPEPVNYSSSKWQFYFVKPSDYNCSGRINDSDPTVLYVSDKFGDNLQSLTPVNENVLSLEIYDKHGFAMMKVQRDQNNDRNFDHRDKDFYYIKLDLKTLKLGKRIEVEGRE